LGNWRTLDELFFLGPVERSLDGAAKARARGARPAWVLGEKQSEVVWRDLASTHAGRHEIQERLRMAAIPVVGARHRVLLGPVEEGFEDDDDWLVADLVDAVAH